MFMVYKYHDDKTKMIIEPIGMYDEFQPAFNDLIRALRNLNYTYKEKYIYENGSYFFTLIDTHNGEKKNNELSFEIIYKDEGIPENNIIKMNVIHL